ESPRQFPKSHIFAADVRVTPNRLGFVVHHRGKRQVFDVNVTGRHNLPNLLAAIAAALEAGMTLAEIAGAARQITPIEGTLQPRRGRKGTLLIDSSYSSNPDGVRAALDYLSIFDDKKKVMLFPGIIELGSESGRIHVELGEKIAGACDMLVILKDDFIEPLLAGIQKSGAQIETLHGLDTGQIHARLWELTGRDTVMLFEGRGTAQYMTPLLTQPPIPNP
ncbi:MAG: glutamate ligase domain-containing protein, partial [Anaerolineales bacterium]